MGLSQLTRWHFRHADTTHRSETFKLIFFTRVLKIDALRCIVPQIVVFVSLGSFLTVLRQNSILHTARIYVNQI